MPRRALLSLLLLGALTACTGPLRLEPVAREPGSDAFCGALRDAAPASVAGQPLREVEPARAGLAWGDPAIVLRCGVAEPGALRPDSPLADVDGIGWLDEQADDGLRFTAVDLPAYVQVDVPEAYQPEADALTDLAEPLRRAAGEAG